MTDQEKIAAFLATKGATRVAPGESVLNYSNRDWRAAVRGERSDNDRIMERHVTVDATGREFVTNGLGERIS